MDKTNSALGFKILRINDKDYKFKANMGDIFGYFEEVEKIGTGKLDKSVVSLQRDLITKLLKQGTPDVSTHEEILFEFELDFKTFIKEVLVAFNIVKKEAFDEETSAKEKN